MIKIIIGLLCVMFANVLLGAKLADLQNKFSWKKLWAGVFKSVCIVVAVGLMYLCSYYNPDIFVASINGINVNLITGMATVNSALCVPLTETSPFCLTFTKPTSPP